MRGEESGRATIIAVNYDRESRTALLTLNGLELDRYTLTVESTLESAQREFLPADFMSEFTAISDFAPLIDVDFTDPRSHRGQQTLTYEVQITNSSEFDLQLPMILTLDPEVGYEGMPRQADEQDSGIWFVDMMNQMPSGGILAPGESTTGRTVIIDNPGDRRVEFESGVLTLPTLNQAPEFESDPNQNATVGVPYQYHAIANDPDGIRVRYFLETAPPGMEVDADTGLIEWTPPAIASIHADVVLYAYDSRGGRDAQGFRILVDGGNHPPEISNLLPEITMSEGSQVSIPINATDSDGDNLIYWADRLPGGATFDSTTRVFLWDTDFLSAGTFEQITFFVSDGVHVVSQSTTLKIEPADRPPTLVDPVDLTLAEGDRLRFCCKVAIWTVT